MRTLLFPTLTLLISLPLYGDQVFDSDGVKIRYTIDGEGEPLVLVHGFTASGAMNWRLPGAIRLLSKRYRVITIDCRGHGRSGKPTRVEAYGVEMVRDVVRLLDHLKIERAHVAGYSMGGMITLKMAALYPNRMRSAMVGGMGWTRPSGRAPVKGEARSPLAACSQAFGALAITREQLTRIKVPLTFIVGADDRFRRGAEAAKAVRPDVPVVLVAGANHVTCVFNRRYLAAIKAFVDKHAGAAPNGERAEPAPSKPRKRYY